MTEDRQHIVEIAGTAIIIFAVLAFSFFIEKPLVAEKGLAFDSLQYFLIAQNFKAQQPVISEAPFVYRIGLPFLVSVFFPKNMFLGFKVINLLGAIISIFLLLMWLRLYLKNTFVKLLLVFLFATHWVGALRLSFYSPIHAESWMTVFNLMGFIVVFYLLKDRQNPLLLAAFCAVIFFGVLFRESVLFLAIIYIVLIILELSPKLEDADFSTRKDVLMAMLPLVAGLLAFFITRLIATPNNSYSLLVIFIYWMYQKPFPTYIQSYFTTYGPMLALLVPSYRIVKDFFGRERFNTYYLVFVCLVAWGIGSDTDRFLYWVMPVMYVVFGLALEYLWPIFQKKRMLLILLIAFQLLAQRSFLPYEEYLPEKIQYRIPALTVVCNEGCGLDIASYNGIAGAGLLAGMCTPSPCTYAGKPYYFQIILFIEHLFVFSLFIYLIMRAQRKLVAVESRH